MPAPSDPESQPITRILSLKTLLDLQRSAGNHAVVQLLRDAGAISPGAVTR